MTPPERIRGEPTMKKLFRPHQQPSNPTRTLAKMRAHHVSSRSTAHPYLKSTTQCGSDRVGNAPQLCPMVFSSFQNGDNAMKQPWMKHCCAWQCTTDVMCSLQTGHPSPCICPRGARFSFSPTLTTSLFAPRYASLATLRFSQTVLPCHARLDPNDR